MKKILLLMLSLELFCFFSVFGQIKIDVADNTFKIAGKGEEVFYYGFAEGDQLIFDFKEENGRDLKEIEIVELPSSSKFMDYKTSRIRNKTINVSQTGIYKFRFLNSAVLGRVCKFKIQRIPASDTTKNFNTTVYTRTVYDTAYTLTQEKCIIKSDTAAINVVDQVAKVSSRMALNRNSNYTIVDFTLPENTICWSYYIGVGTEGKEEYQKANNKFLSSAAKVVSKIPNYGTMAALALSGINYFSKVQGKDNVKYYFITDWNNLELFKSDKAFIQYKQGDVVNDAYRMTKPLTGKVYLALKNDNIMEPIDIIVKVTAITVTPKWGTKTIKKIEGVMPREEQYLKNE